MSTADRDDRLGAPDGELAGNLPELGGSSGACVGQIGEQCWIGDAATKFAGAACAGTGSRGSIEDVASWAICAMVRGADGGGRWVVGSGSSLSCRASSRDCQLFDWHPDADATIDVRLAQRAWFQHVGYPHAVGLLRAPRLVAPAP